MLYSAFPPSQQVSRLTSHDDRSCSAYETIGEVARYIVALAVVIQLHPAADVYTAPAGHSSSQPSADHAVSGKCYIARYILTGVKYVHWLTNK